LSARVSGRYTSSIFQVRECLFFMACEYLISLLHLRLRGGHVSYYNVGLVVSFAREFAFAAGRPFSLFSINLYSYRAKLSLKCLLRYVLFLIGLYIKHKHPFIISCFSY